MEYAWWMPHRQVHRHGQGAKGDCEPGHRCSRAADDQILALTDALGNLVRFVLLPGQRNGVAR